LNIVNKGTRLFTGRQAGRRAKQSKAKEKKRKSSQTKIAEIELNLPAKKTEQ
jgi:hypothetical protein